MPKQPLQEIFSQGLVTSRPAHMLAAGELTRADHTVYRENNVALQRAPDHGTYSDESLNTFFANSTCTGIITANFENEDYPDQLIARVGDDLLSSNITGPANNEFNPITFPGRDTGTFGTTGDVVVQINATTNTIIVSYPGVGPDAEIIVGRPVFSDTVFPEVDTTVVTGVTRATGGYITSFTVSRPSTNTSVVYEHMYFAPKCTLLDNVIYADSVGFNVSPVDTFVMKSSDPISSCLYKPSDGYIKPPVANPTAFNNYAAVGRIVTMTASGGYSYTGLILKIGVTSGNVDKVYVATGWANPNDEKNPIVTFAADPRRTFITAVADLAEEGTNMPVYSSMYINWFPKPGSTHELVFSGGLSRKFKGGSNNQVFDGLSWDTSMFLWDGNIPIHRLEYRNRMSFNQNAPLLRTIVARPVGLQPVVNAPIITKMTDGGGEANKPAWNRSLEAGIYWFLVTEAYIPNLQEKYSDVTLQTNFVESSYLAAYNLTNHGSEGLGVQGQDITMLNADSDSHVGHPIPIRISDVTTDYVKLEMKAPRNNGTNGYVANSWCVYIAGPTTNFLEPPPYVRFTRTHVVPFAHYDSGQIIYLQDSQDTRVVSPQTYNAPVLGRNKWEQRATANHYHFESMYQIPPDLSGQYYYGFAGEDYHAGEDGNWPAADFIFPDVLTGDYAGKTITGLKLSIEEAGSKRFHYEFDVGNNLGGHSKNWHDGWYTLDLGTSTSTNYIYEPHKPKDAENYQAKDYGSPQDMWRLPQASNWGSLRLRVTKCASADYSHVCFGNIQLTVYYSTSTVNLSGPAYRCVTYRSAVGSSDISDPARLPPPIASMGDTFQGSLVVNDVNHGSFIRYSLPDEPESFPMPYRMRMGTKRKGKITALKTFKQVLIVGMERAIKRINYLPKEVDTDFTQGAGLSHEDISNTHGIVGPDAICDFDMPGIGPAVAYVSTVGLRFTTGVDSRALNTDVILKDLVHPDYWDKCMLRAFPNQKWLVLYYVPKGTTHGIRSKSLCYSYSEDHIKGGATIVLSGNPPLTGPLPVTGPNDCYVVDSCDIIINSSPQVATTDGEFVYIEDSTENWMPVYTTDGDTTNRVYRTNVPYIKSRDIFPAGFTQEANIGSVYLMYETKGMQEVVSGATSYSGSTQLHFDALTYSMFEPLPGHSVIHGGWDSPPIILAVEDNIVTVSSPAVRQFTGDATFDNGSIMVRVNAAQFGEDEVPILTEYRSTSVGVGTGFVMDGSANRFSMEIVKVQNPNTGDLQDILSATSGTGMSIIGMVYHAAPQGETALYAN